MNKLLAEAEEWVSCDPEYRFWRLERHGGEQVLAELRQYGTGHADYFDRGDTPEEALSAALRKARGK